VNARIDLNLRGRVIDPEALGKIVECQASLLRQMPKKAPQILEDPASRRQAPKR
jgi:hypothetical protein